MGKIRRKIAMYKLTKYAFGFENGKNETLPLLWQKSPWIDLTVCPLYRIMKIEDKIKTLSPHLLMAYSGGPGSFCLIALLGILQYHSAT
jgi:hypothetical protein